MVEMRNGPSESVKITSYIPKYLKESRIVKKESLKPTLIYKAGRFGASKGKYPAIRTKRITPQDHTSADAPSYPLLLRT